MTYSKNTGFTLIEVLLGVLIFVIICGSLYFSIHVGLNSIKRERADYQIFQELRVCLRQLRKDLRSTFYNKALEIETLSGDEHSLSLICYNVHGLYKISYYKQANDFLRSTEKIFFTEENNKKTIEFSEPKIYHIAGLLKSVDFEYLSFDGSWKPCWDTNKMYPKAVGVTLYFVGQGKNNYEFHTIISIPIGKKISMLKNEK